MSRLRWALCRHFFEFGALFHISNILDHLLDFEAEGEQQLLRQHLRTFFFTIFHMFDAIFCRRNVSSKPINSIITDLNNSTFSLPCEQWFLHAGRYVRCSSLHCSQGTCRLTVVIKMHNYPINRGNSRFT